MRRVNSLRAQTVRAHMKHKPGICLANRATWMRAHRTAALRRLCDAQVGPAARQMVLGEPYAFA